MATCSRALPRGRHIPLLQTSHGGTERLEGLLIKDGGFLEADLLPQLEGN